MSLSLLEEHPFGIAVVGNKVALFLFLIFFSGLGCMLVLEALVQEFITAYCYNWPKALTELV